MQSSADGDWTRNGRRAPEGAGHSLPRPERSPGRFLDGSGPRASPTSPAPSRAASHSARSFGRQVERRLRRVQHFTAAADGYLAATVIWHKPSSLRIVHPILCYREVRPRCSGAEKFTRNSARSGILRKARKADARHAKRRRAEELLFDSDPPPVACLASALRLCVKIRSASATSRRFRPSLATVSPSSNDLPRQRGTLCRPRWRP